MLESTISTTIWICADRARGLIIGTSLNMRSAARSFLSIKLSEEADVAAVLVELQAIPWLAIDRRSSEAARGGHQEGLEHVVHTSSRGTTHEGEGGVAASWSRLNFLSEAARWSRRLGPAQCGKTFGSKP